VSSIISIKSSCHIWLVFDFVMFLGLLKLLSVFATVDEVGGEIFSCALVLQKNTMMAPCVFVVVVVLPCPTVRGHCKQPIVSLVRCFFPRKRAPAGAKGFPASRRRGPAGGADRWPTRSGRCPPTRCPPPHRIPPPSPPSPLAHRPFPIPTGPRWAGSNGKK